MNNFNWIKGFGLGAVLWLIIFAVVSALVGFNWYGSVWTELTVALGAGALAYLFTASVSPQTAGEAFGYGLLWAAIAIVLDFLVSARFNEVIFGAWTYWLGFALIILAPTLSLLGRSESVVYKHTS